MGEAAADVRRREEAAGHLGKLLPQHLQDEINHEHREVTRELRGAAWQENLKRRNLLNVALTLLDHPYHPFDARAPRARGNPPPAVEQGLKALTKGGFDTATLPSRRAEIEAELGTLAGELEAVDRDIEAARAALTSEAVEAYFSLD